ncbi:MAG: acetylglutamate kinase [Chitinophagaceae bacterium]|nr:acetylglutamate kinase [Chitinophagaceae bacterium]
MKENMYYGASHLIFQKAEELRNRMTPAEEVLWKLIHINEWKLKFRRQHPIWNYVADFYCHKLKLVIELDGGIHEQEDVKKYDEARENHLKEFGLTILRFKNEQVLSNSDEVMKEIAQTIAVLSSTPLGDGGGDGGKTLYVIKIGGNIIDDNAKLDAFLKSFAAVEGKKILVHGGGKLATRMAEQMGIEQQLIDGRRITDAETLKIVTMVYAGYINKNIVATLQSNHCNAMGLCGADGDAILAHKRNHPVLDYGFVGDVDAINADLLQVLLEKNITLVFAPITHNQQGQLLNTNADTIAQEIAKGMSPYYEVELIYSFEKSGVLLDANDDNTVIPEITPAYYKELKAGKKIFDGMIPKLDNAFAALDNGVQKVIIGKAEQLPQLVEGTAGTSIIHER